MRILKENTIAVVIDIQQKLFPHISNFEEIAKKNSILIQGLKLLEVPVLVTEQYPKGLGTTIEQLTLALGEYTVIEKASFSCCDEPSFMNELKRLNCTNVILCGIETHVCVLQTAVDLIKLGFNPIIIEDCVSSRTENNKRIAMERMKHEGAMISSCESILFEICRYSGTDIFKEISKIVK